MTRKHTNNWMQKKPNNFGLRCSYEENITNIVWISNITKELEGLEEDLKITLTLYSQKGLKLLSCERDGRRLGQTKTDCYIN